MIYFLFHIEIEEKCGWIIGGGGGGKGYVGFPSQIIGGRGLALPVPPHPTPMLQTIPQAMTQTSAKYKKIFEGMHLYMRYTLSVSHN